MYRFKGYTKLLTVKIGDKHYYMAGSHMDFMLVGNRWVSVAQTWGTPKLRGKTLIFRGQLDRLTEIMRSGLIVEHPEWLGVLPTSFDIENWKANPGPLDFERMWDQSRDIQTLTTKKAIRLGMLTPIVDTGRYDWPLSEMGRPL